MKISILIMLFAFCSVLKAQDLEQISRSREFTDIRTNMNLIGTSDVAGKNQSNVSGSPYLYNSWNNKAKIYYDDKVYVINNFNYNIYSERFESKLSEDSILIINPRNIKSILIDDKVFGRYLDPEFIRNSYFEEIVKFDNYFLLKKYIVKIKPGSVNPLTKVKLSSDELKQDEIFYICDLENNNELKKIKLKKSTILGLIKTDYTDNINNYAKKDKLNYKSIEDVRKLILYYNALQNK